MSDAAARLRVPPHARFKDQERRFDLESAFARLAEESVMRNGHVQKALYRCGPTTTAIFAFEAGAGLDRYVLDGLAIMHVLLGRVRVTTDADSYELTRDEILLLDPEVPQRLAALEPSRLLMTFVCEDGG